MTRTNDATDLRANDLENQNSLPETYLDGLDFEQLRQGVYFDQLVQAPYDSIRSRLVSMNFASPDDSLLCVIDGW